mmetsp:Transcript_25068/g.52732  ORF Transcript_25068/g.52732 Transcript_25068/m.52732 type:complete len:255 (+) Transcript_25068:1595-2359(+)
MLEQFLKFVCFQIFKGIILQMKNQPRSRSINWFTRIFRNSIRIRCIRSPSQLRRAGLHTFRHDLHLICHQIRRIKSHTKLTNEINIRRSLAQCLQKLLRPRLRNPSKIVHEFRFGHSHARVFDGDGHGVFVRFDLDGRFGEGGSRAVVRSDGEEAFFVARVSSVGDEFAKEDVAVGIERVDDDIHDAADFCLEFKSLAVRDSFCIHDGTIRHGQRSGRTTGELSRRHHHISRRCGWSNKCANCGGRCKKKGDCG